MSIRIIPAVCFFLLASSALAQERILDYHADIQIQPDGSMEVSEKIRVVAEGRQIRRGIYRDFPTRYRDRFGNQLTVDFEVIEVLRDGRPEPWFTERISGGVRLNTGDDRRLPLPATLEFTLRYRTSRQLGFFEHHDELYWNVSGNDWAFPIEQAGARVQLPAAVAAGDFALDYYTGPRGARGKAAEARVVAPGVVEFITTSPLPAGHGLTIVAGWPKGLIEEPGFWQEATWLLADNAGVLVALIGLLGVFGFYFWQWHLRGRDPAAGIIITRYEPPAGYTPAGLRYLRSYNYDNTCLVADLVDLAVAGRIRIACEEKKGFFSNKKEWFIERADSGDDSQLAPAEAALLRALFRGKHALTGRIKIDQANVGHLQKAMRAHKKALKHRYHGDYYVSNASVTTIGFLASVAVVALAVFVSKGFGIGLIIGGGVLLLLLNLLFAWLMHAPTARGRKLLDYGEGLKDYLAVAEKSELARLKHDDAGEPRLDATRFERLLPWAIALDVEKAWTKKFEGAVGQAAAEQAARNITWYHGSARIGSIGELGSSLGSSFATQLAASSSSGGGGGGSSGGGGGGGGGGGR